MIVETGEMVVVDSDPANIPVFRGTGYVSYSLPVLTSQTIQWTLSIPVTSVYYMALTYHLPIREGENAFTANFILSRNSLMMSSQVPVSICPSPPCSTLSRTTFTLEQGTWTVGLHFPSRSVPTPEFYIVCYAGYNLQMYTLVPTIMLTLCVSVLTSGYDLAAGHCVCLSSHIR